MSVTERDRQRMIRAFEQSWDEEVAMIVVEHLPPVGWADVATRRDIDGLQQNIETLRHVAQQDIETLRQSTQQDVATLRHDMHKDVEVVRHDIDGLRHATQQEFDNLRREVRSEFDAVRKDAETLRTTLDSRLESVEHRLLSMMSQKFAEQTKAMIVAFVASLMAFGTLVLAAALLGRP